MNFNFSSSENFIWNVSIVSPQWFEMERTFFELRKNNYANAKKLKLKKLTEKRVTNKCDNCAQFLLILNMKRWVSWVVYGTYPPANDVFHIEDVTNKKHGIFLVHLLRPKKTTSVVERYFRFKESQKTFGLPVKDGEWKNGTKINFELFYFCIFFFIVWWSRILSEWEKEWELVSESTTTVSHEDVRK